MKPLLKPFLSLLLFLLILPAVYAQSNETDADMEAQIAKLLKQDDNQKRISLNYNAILARVARERAYDMGERNYFGHVNPDGIGANYLVTSAGYALPDFYGKDRSANNVESIAAGNGTVTSTWMQWMNSTGHRTHILGLINFYAQQIDYGVGHAFIPGSRYGHYWVIITAKPGESGGLPTLSASISNSSVSSSDCGGASSSYPNVIHDVNNNLKPACGYVWVNSNDPKDFRVKLIVGLLKDENGNLYPDNGYRWVNPDDPKDITVEPVP